MKTRHKIAITAIILFLLSSIYVCYLMAQHPYLDIDCPNCHQHRVLSFGSNSFGDANGQCLDCGSEITIYGYDTD